MHREACSPIFFFFSSSSYSASASFLPPPLHTRQNNIGWWWRSDAWCDGRWHAPGSQQASSIVGFPGPLIRCATFNTQQIGGRKKNKIKREREEGREGTSQTNTKKTPTNFYWVVHRTYPSKVTKSKVTIVKPRRIRPITYWRLTLSVPFLWKSFEILPLSPFFFFLPLSHLFLFWVVLFCWCYIQYKSRCVLTYPELCWQEFDFFFPFSFVC